MILTLSELKQIREALRTEFGRGFESVPLYKKIDEAIKKLGK